ncbi:MAG: hypothetical protein PHP54_01230 [Clostridia bacterium]|nr:hypothetical protein [Clostridia bacterium]
MRACITCAFITPTNKVILGSKEGELVELPKIIWNGYLVSSHEMVESRFSGIHLISLAGEVLGHHIDENKKTLDAFLKFYIEDEVITTKKGELYHKLVGYSKEDCKDGAIGIETLKALNKVWNSI